MVRDNRAFLGRAVTWAAGHGIAQFLDLGTGLPLRPAVHESARAVIPDARIGYVDNDAMACSRVQAPLATDEGVQHYVHLDQPDLVIQAIRDLVWRCTR